MDGKQFIDAVKICVRRPAIKGAIKNLADPPGRRITDFDRQHSQWFNGLSIEDKQNVEAAITKAVDDALFGFLAVIDGVRVVEDTVDKGEFTLLYRNDGETIINDPKAQYLHDLYNCDD